MSNISCPPGHPSIISKSIYDRQLDTDLFKRLHAINYTLAPKRYIKSLGPGSYNPKTIDEIYREKSCSKYGPYHQQSKRFPSKNRKSKHLCHIQEGINGLYNIPDELQRKREFERRYNSIRLDRQSNDQCRKQKEFLPQTPPVTLYEKKSFIDELQCKQTGKMYILFLGIYGPYVKLAQDRSNQYPNWYKGPARIQDKLPPTILDNLFSQSNRYKGKFLPIPSNFNSINKNQRKSIIPGPTTYFKELISSKKFHSLNLEKNPLLGFLSSTERFQKTKTSFSHIGPASYNPHGCSRLCTKKKQKNA